MTSAICLFVSLSLLPLACPAEDQVAEPALAIQERGSITVSDGSSFYTFNKDGTFLSGPWGISGRMIEGRWRQEPGSRNRFLVEGRWSWMNGTSLPHDFRKMVVVVYPGTFNKVPKDRLGFASVDEILDCYFIIDGLSPK